MSLFDEPFFRPGVAPSIDPSVRRFSRSEVPPFRVSSAGCSPRKRLLCPEAAPFSDFTVRRCLLPEVDPCRGPSVLRPIVQSLPRIGSTVQRSFRLEVPTSRGFPVQRSLRQGIPLRPEAAACREAPPTRGSSVQRFPVWRSLRQGIPLRPEAAPYREVRPTSGPSV